MESKYAPGFPLHGSSKRTMAQRTPGRRSHPTSFRPIPYTGITAYTFQLLLSLSDDKALSASISSCYVFRQLCLKAPPASNTYPVLSPCFLEPLRSKPKLFSMCQSFKHLREPESAPPQGEKSPVSKSSPYRMVSTHTHTGTNAHPGCLPYALWFVCVPD